MLFLQETRLAQILVPGVKIKILAIDIKEGGHVYYLCGHAWAVVKRE
jgi:hypothetical protein